jgi:DNA-binding SARP family transcriptional activator
MQYNLFTEKEQRIWENVYSISYVQKRSAAKAKKIADAAVEELKRLMKDDEGSDW